MKHTIINKEELRDCFGILPSGLYTNGEQVALPQDIADAVLNTPHQQVDELDSSWSELEAEPTPMTLELDQIDYEQEVINRIRERYTLDEELAILRQRDTKPQEFSEYFDFCEQVKSDVKQLINN